MTALEPVVQSLPAALVDAELASLRDRARGLAHESRAASTWKAYDSDFAHFARWCLARGLHPLPATTDTVGVYLAAHEGALKPSTLRRRLAAVSVYHRAAGHPTPTTSEDVLSVLAGIQRRRGIAPVKKTAARTSVIAALVAGLDPERLVDVRDRVLILWGFAGAFRRSELVAVDIERVTEEDGGLRVGVPWSKTDQEGRGSVKGLPYGSTPSMCPVRAWRAWIAASGITAGPAFRAVIGKAERISDRRLSDRVVANMLDRRARAAGLAGDFAGHSLRSGFATEAYSRGTPELSIMRQGNWRAASTMRGYVQEGELFANNAAAKLGL